MRFEDHVVWITGGGSGIGRAMALAFAKEGAHLALSGRRSDRLEEVAAEIESMGRRCLSVPLDVTDEQAVMEAADAVFAEYGHLDVVVANAGFGVAGRFEKLTADHWRHQFDVNVVGLTSTVRAALPFLKERKGRIVLLGSVMSQVAVPGNGAYTASKYAVRAIGQTLSMELHGTGVTCTTVHPGFVESEIGQVDNKGVFDESREDPRPSRFMWPADRAAKVCLDAIAARKREFVFTGHGKVAAFLGRHFPGLNHFALTRNKKGKSHA